MTTSRLLFAGCGLAALLAAPLPARAEDPFVAAVRGRQERYACVRLEVSLAQFIPKGAKTDDIAEFAPANKRVLPPEDTTYSSDNVVVFRGPAARMEDNHPRAHAALGRFTLSPTVHVTDGQLHANITPARPDLPQPPSGYIGRSAVLEHLRLTWWAPITLHYRGLTRLIAPTLVEPAKPTGGRATIDGTACLEYAVTHTPQYQELLWIDPQASHVIRRMRSMANGRVANQHDIRYSPGADPRPTGWTYTAYGRRTGKVAEVVTATVRTEQPDPAVSDDDFRITFPPGYYVGDARDNARYLVQPDGSMIQVDRATGEPFGSSVAQPTAGWLRRNWLVVLLSAALAAVAAAVRRR